LVQAIGKLVHTRSYRLSLIDDQAMRHDVGGRMVEPVGAMDRHSAALLDHAEALRFTAKARQQETAPAPPRQRAEPKPEPKPEPRSEPRPEPVSSLPSAPALSSSSPRRETLRLGKLSETEIVRRKQALGVTLSAFAGLKRRDDHG
jgi:hypothetical protein